MSIFAPEAVKVQGNDKLIFVTTMANPASPGLATEINAATSVEGTMAMYGSWNPSWNVNTGNAPPRLGTTVQLPQEGNAQMQPIAITYPYDPSVDDTDPNNELKALLQEGTELYVFVRRGVDKDEPFAAGDRGQTWRVRCGKPVEAAVDEGNEFAEYTMAQNLIPLSEPVDAVLAA